MKHLLTLNHFFVKYKWRLLLGVLFVFLSNYFKILQPQMVREALDLVFDNINTAAMLEGTALEGTFIASTMRILLLFGVIVIGLAIVMGIFMYFTRQTIIVVSRLIEYDLRNQMFKKYTELHLGFYRSNNTGDLMARITEDVSKVRDYLGPAILYGLNLIALFSMTIYTMFKVNVTLSIYTLAPLPLLSISIYFVSSIISRKSELIQRQLALLNSLAQEIYSGIRVVKSYVQEKAMGKYYLQECDDYMDKNLDLAKTNAFFAPLMLLLVGASTIITVYVGGLQVIKGNVTPGNIAEFVIYINMLTWPVTSIGWIASIVQQAEASMKRLNEFMESEIEITNPEQGYGGEIRGELSFQNVSFTYPDTGIQALRDVNFKVKPGERIGIVGRTASGKTTIADLIVRMYDPQDGSILLDGIDLREWDLKHLRSQIGYVPQNDFLFSDSIRNNIAFTQPEADLTEVKKFAEYASVHNDIMGFNKQYEELIGERGVTLSGGQKQRVSIARALMTNPSLVIMDDSLSAVDTDTEQKIIEYMKTALAGKTVVMVTHRLNILLDFDKIIVLEEGRIVETGTHLELIEKGGAYFETFERQKLLDTNESI